MRRVIFGLRVAMVGSFALAAMSCGDNTGTAVCGNGSLEPGEKCDTSIAQGQNGACPDVTARHIQSSGPGIVQNLTSVEDWLVSGTEFATG